MKHPFEIWFPGVMVMICIVLSTVSVIHRSWISLVTFILVGVTFWLHLLRASKS